VSEEVPVQFGIQLYQSLRELPAQERIIGGLSALESKGFSSFYVMDHHLRTFDDGYLSPLPTLAFCAARTETAKLGQAIIITTLHHPIHLAEQFATVDQLSEGRLVIGAGVGWNRREFEAFGVPYDQRAAIFEQSLDVIRSLWTGRAVSHTSDTYGFEDVTLGLTPFRRDSIPIMLAGIGKRALARVARLGDGWIPSLWISEPELRDALQQLRRDCLDAGRPESRHIAVSRFCYIRSDGEEAWSTAAPALSRYLTTRSEWNHPILGAYGEMDPTNVASRTIIGSIKDAVESVQRYADMGVDQINFRLSLEGLSANQVWETAEVLADEVLPAIQPSAPAT
jgi:probable F420-dependent oxidoreductase